MLISESTALVLLSRLVQTSYDRREEGKVTSTDKYKIQ